MAFHLVAEEPSARQSQYPFYIWRCSFCRALYVERYGGEPPKVCQKCHNR